MMQAILFPSLAAMLLTPLVAAVVSNQQEFERAREKARLFASKPGHKRAAARIGKEKALRMHSSGVTSR